MISCRGYRFSKYDGEDLIVDAHEIMNDVPGQSLPQRFTFLIERCIVQFRGHCTTILVLDFSGCILFG